jgi:hypothetical protein
MNCSVLEQRPPEQLPAALHLVPSSTAILDQALLVLVVVF